MKTCAICGTPISWPKVNYCCEKCRRIASYLGIRKKTPEEKELEKLYTKWKKVFNCKEKRILKRDAWKFRIFLWAALECCGFTQNQVARVVEKDHSTLKHHRESTKWNEKIVAQEFSKTKNYKFRGLPIYPPDFKYLDIKEKKQ